MNLLLEPPGHLSFLPAAVPCAQGSLRPNVLQPQLKCHFLKVAFLGQEPVITCGWQHSLLICSLLNRGYLPEDL